MLYRKCVKSGRKSDPTVSYAQSTRHTERHSLDNGIKVIAQRRRGIDSAVVLTFPYGLSHDPYIPHFLEHILFRTCGDLKGGAVDCEIESLGGFYTGYTDTDKIVLTARFLAKNSRRAIELLYRSLTDMRIDSGTLEKERRIIIGELQGRRSDPTYFLDEAQSADLLKGDQLYVRPEQIQEIRRVKGTDLIEAKREFIGARNMHIGTVSPNSRELLTCIEDTFGKLGDHGAEIQKFELNKPKITTRTHRRSGYNDNTISINFLTPGFGTDDENTITLAVNTLAGTCQEYSNRNRLWRILRENTGLIYHVDVRHQVYSNVGIMEITCSGILRENVGNVKRIILEEIARITEEEIGERELLASKDSLLISESREIEEEPIEEAAERLAVASLYGRVISYSEFARKLNDTSGRKIRKVAKMYLKEGRMSIGILKAA